MFRRDRACLSNHTVYLSNTIWWSNRIYPKGHIIRKLPCTSLNYCEPSIMEHEFIVNPVSICNPMYY